MKVSRGIPGVGVGFLLAAAWSVFASVATPGPVPSSAPDDRFSAERAMVHIRAVATAPRPTGSPGAEAARDHLEGVLTDLGVSPTQYIFNRF